MGKPLAGEPAPRVVAPALLAIARSALAGPDQHRRPARHRLARRLFARGDWVWRWKDWIDRRFMRVQRIRADGANAAPRKPAAAIPLDAAEQTQAISAIAMRCGGCGAKVGATVLSRALARVTRSSATTC
jgi:hypothetical protein